MYSYFSYSRSVFSLPLVLHNHKFDCLFQCAVPNPSGLCKHADLLQRYLISYCWFHYRDVIIAAMASQITSFTIAYSTVYSGADQRKHQSSASLTFVRGIHRWPVYSPHKWPVTRKMFPFDDFIMFLSEIPSISSPNLAQEDDYAIHCYFKISSVIRLCKSHAMLWHIMNYLLVPSWHLTVENQWFCAITGSICYEITYHSYLVSSGILCSIASGEVVNLMGLEYVPANYHQYKSSN